MKDLDEYRLKQMTMDATLFVEMGGQVFVAVPLDLLQRVVSHFEVDHIQRELRGPRYRQ